MPKNKLEDFDFCLRKAIGYQLHQQIKHAGINLSDFAKSIGVRQPDISKWATLPIKKTITSTDSCAHAPTFLQIIKACTKLEVAILDMLYDAIEADKHQQIPLLCKEFVKEATNLVSELQLLDKNKSIEKRIESIAKSPTDLSRVIKLERSTYLGFFLHKNKDAESYEVDHFILDSYSALNSGAVPVLIRTVGRSADIYRGNIVSPIGQPYLYIYMRQDSGKKDRGIMAFHFFEGDIQGQFRCGSGIVLSTERNLNTIHLQWVVLIRIQVNKKMIGNETIDENYTIEKLRETQERAEEINHQDEVFLQENRITELDSIIRPVLEQALPSPRGHYLILDELDERQKVFHDEYYTKRIGDSWFSKNHR